MKAKQLNTRWAWLGVVLGAVLSQACERNGTGNIRINGTCRDYCQQAHECDNDVDIDECRSDCEDTMDDCMSDEQEEALDDLDDCATQSCDEFGTCTIGAGLQCTFGL